MNSESLINKISETIHSQDPYADAILFGSRARGDSRPDSDWDLIILVNEPKVTNEIEDKFRDKLYDIELESGQIISAFIYPKKYWNSILTFSPLYQNVSREGIKL